MQEGTEGPQRPRHEFTHRFRWERKKKISAKQEQELPVPERQVCRALDRIVNKSQHLRLHPKGHSCKSEGEIRATSREILMTAATSGLSSQQQRFTENPSPELLSRIEIFCNKTREAGFCPVKLMEASDKYLLAAREGNRKLIFVLSWLSCRFLTGSKTSRSAFNLKAEVLSTSPQLTSKVTEVTSECNNLWSKKPKKAQVRVRPCSGASCGAETAARATECENSHCK